MRVPVRVRTFTGTWSTEGRCWRLGGGGESVGVAPHGMWLADDDTRLSAQVQQQLAPHGKEGAMQRGPNIVAELEKARREVAIEVQPDGGAISSLHCGAGSV